MTDSNYRLISDAINDAHGTQVEPQHLEAMGRDTLRMETEFNMAAGFTEAGNTLLIST